MKWLVEEIAVASILTLIMITVGIINFVWWYKFELKFKFF